jgi:hypothetical protein
MSEIPNKLGRQPIAIITIDMPINVSPFHTDEAIEEALQECVDKLSFPQEARVRAYVGFMPDPTQEIKILNVQGGIYGIPSQ